MSVFLLWLFAGRFTYGQDFYHFRTLSPKGGFYYDGVKDIIQDNDGFIWVLLENDLLRFDGYEYKSHLSYFRNTKAFHIRNFRNLGKDTSGNIYISTNNAVLRYNKLSDNFDKIAEEDISNFELDTKNNIWYTSKDQLYKINSDRKTIDSIYFNGKPITGIGYFTSAPEGMYFAAYSNKIYFQNHKQSAIITLFHLFPPHYSIVGIKKVGGYLWVLTKADGIFKINTSAGNIEQKLQFRRSNDNIAIKTFHVDKNNKIWIGSQNGLYIVDSATGESQLYLHSKSDIFSLPNNSIWKITEDIHRNILIGTFGGGLCHINLDEGMPFKTFTPLQSSISHGLVSSFAEDENYLWIGTEGDGLNEMNKSTTDFTTYRHEESGNSLSYNNIKSLLLDSHRRLWIAMYRGGLDCFDTKTKKFRHFRNNPDNKESLYCNDLRKIIPEGDSGLWVAYQTNLPLISYFSFEDERFIHYIFGENSYVLDIQKDNRGHLWIITREHLYKMDTNEHTIENISQKHLSTLDAQSLCIDACNNVWIGAIGRGLAKYDTSTSEFIFFQDILSYHISSIYSMCPDDSACLWLGTDNGLFKYNTEDNSYLRFDESDGIQGQVFFPLASFKSKTGALYFGGSNGFTMFNPHDVKSNMTQPEVIISDFYIDNVRASSEFNADLVKGEIVLNHNQTNFGFKFSSDNYLSPDKNTFKYRLKGYDERWILTDASNRTAMYSKVPDGIYYFEILTANNDGMWSTVPTVIKIKRKAAPWNTWPAYLLYFVICSGITIVIFYYYNEKRKLKTELYKENLEKQKNEEIHQSQLRFFTNISHDFKTPLSLILATTDNLKQEGLKDFYYHILHNNANRILNLVNELMDFRTIEHGKMQLRVQPLDVNGLVNKLSSDFKDYARKKNVEFDIICAPEMPHRLYADKQILEKVVVNLLSNAFKHTKPDGRIAIETYFGYTRFSTPYTHSYHIADQKELENRFLIVVRDTGVGISEESISTVFERFYKVNTANLNQHLGTGIGLALVKSLVLLHKGTISIYSERGKGTDMVVAFSTDASVYDKCQLDESEETVQQIATPGIMLAENTTNTDSMEDMFRREKKKILLVEDNHELKLLISAFLSEHYDVLEANNGVEATRILEQVEADLIISDIMMPFKNGITLCREIKNDVNTSHIPFILLTAKAGLESKMEGADSGADVYFEKPIDFNLLLMSIRNIFKQQQNLREYYAKNYYVDSAELSANSHDNIFLKKLVKIIDKSLNQPNIDVNFIASQLMMSRSKLYSKIKMLTDKSIVEFILNYRLRKAARLIIEQDMSMYQIMEEIGIKSQSYFTNSFKKEFGKTPSAFAAKHKKTNNS